MLMASTLLLAWIPCIGRHCLMSDLPLSGHQAGKSAPSFASLPAAPQCPWRDTACASLTTSQAALGEPCLLSSSSR